MVARVDRVEHRAAPRSERVQVAVVDDHVVGGRDDLGEAPPELPLVASQELLPRHGVVAARAFLDSVVPRPRGGVDRDDDKVIPECATEDFEFLPTADSVDDRGRLLNPRHRALGPDPEPVADAVLMGHAAHGLVAELDPAPIRLVAHDVAHADDGQATLVRHPDELLLAATWHSCQTEDADHFQSGKGWTV